MWRSANNAIPSLLIVRQTLWREHLIATKWDQWNRRLFLLLTANFNQRQSSSATIPWHKGRREENSLSFCAEMREICCRRTLWSSSSSASLFMRTITSTAATTQHNHKNNDTNINNVQSPLHVRPLTRILDEKIALGIWRSDPVQRRGAKKLERLQSALSEYSNQRIVDFCIQQGKRIEERNQKQKEAKYQSIASGINNKFIQVGMPSREASSSISVTEGKKTAGIETEMPSSDAPSDNNVGLDLPKIPRGLYLHGPVGIGKSMLMDIFFDAVSVVGDRKRRFHFHAFMTEIHKRIHNLKRDQLEREGRNFSVDTNPQNNPIRRVAVQIAQELSLLCLDEFQVTDIADALVLSQLFSALFSYGTVVVATSNRLPSQLYEGGLNRSYFLPFIDLLEKHCIVHTLQSDVDYRVLLASLSDCTLQNLFLDGSDPKSATIFQDMISSLRQNQSAVLPVVLDVSKQRKLKVARGDETGWLAQFSFSELCEVKLGASDYRALANHFSIIALQDVPTFSISSTSSANLDHARRFVTLLDELYESKSTALLCLTDAAKDPYQLFQISRSRGRDHTTDGNDGCLLDEVGNVASVRELAFAFERAASRLFEMTSKRWWDSVVGLQIKMSQQ
ncbi:hypothetical protein ACA910_021054 [Epithemia clementina (nom. ined.)]